MTTEAKLEAPKRADNTTWLASFDIGKRNFAFYIEEIKSQELYLLETIPVKKRYNDDGTPTPKMEEILKKVTNNGKSIIHKNTDLTYNCDKTKYLDTETFYNMYDLLDKYSNYWDQCEKFVIEQQMNFGKRKNPMAMKLGQHCYSYFIFSYGRFKGVNHVIEFPSYHKTQVLGAQKERGKKYKNGNYKWKSMDQRSRKKWSVVKAIEILTDRGEEDVINNIKTKAKKDDLADTLTQLQAYKFLHYVAKFK